MQFLTTGFLENVNYFKSVGETFEIVLVHYVL